MKSPCRVKMHRHCFDLDQAKSMLEMMLPKDNKLKEIEDNLGVRVYSHFEPCDVTGGDFWGCSNICCNHVAFYIADCSGHGFTSALNAFRLHALLEDLDDMYIKLAPANFLFALNAKMCQLMAPGHFATFFYGVINTHKNEITYSSAGSTAPVIIKKNGTIKLLNSQGFPLGVTRDADFTNHKVSFKKGDRLLLHSDAVAETHNKKGHMLSEEKLLKIISQNTKTHSDQLIIKILSKQKQHRHGELHDDLTLNIYCRL